MQGPQRSSDASMSSVPDGGRRRGGASGGGAAWAAPACLLASLGVCSLLRLGLLALAAPCRSRRWRSRRRPPYGPPGPSDPGRPLRPLMTPPRSTRWRSAPTSMSSRGRRSMTSSWPSSSRTSAAISDGPRVLPGDDEHRGAGVHLGGDGERVLLADEVGHDVGKPSSSSAPSGDSASNSRTLPSSSLRTRSTSRTRTAPSVDGSCDRIADAALPQLAAKSDDRQVHWPDRRPGRSRSRHGTPSPGSWRCHGRHRSPSCCGERSPAASPQRGDAPWIRSRPVRLAAGRNCP